MNKDHHQNRHNRLDEKGAAVVEFSICAVLLIAILIGVAEIARLQNNYFGLVRTAREAVGYGIRTELASNVLCSSDLAAPCAETSHILMHDRAKYLTQELAKDIALDGSLKWESFLTEDPSSPRTHQTLRFTVDAEIPALFGAFNFPVSVTVVGGYFGNPDSLTPPPLLTTTAISRWSSDGLSDGDYSQQTRNRG